MRRAGAVDRAPEADVSVERVARLAGFEPTTSASAGQRSIH